MGRKIAVAPERTISIELHNAWLALKRKGDPERMATELGYSRPVIDKALIYGYVSMQGLVDDINRYFHERLTKERATATELMAMADQTKK